MKFWPDMSLFKKLETKTKKRKKTIILPESYDKRVLKAAKELIKKGIAKVILIQNDSGIKINSSKNLAVIDIDFSVQFAEEYAEIKKKKNLDYTVEDAKEELKDHLIFA